MNTNQGRFTGFLLGALFFLALLPTLNSTRLGEVDELIYARVSQDAARLNHWLPLTCGGTLWSEKPPLLLWLAGLTAKLSGSLTQSWPYRLWSLLGAALCVSALLRLGAMAGSWRAGVFAALLFALQGDFLFHARFFSMDTAMLGCVLMAVVAATRGGWKESGLWLTAGIWIKSWFILAFFPALGFALWRNLPKSEAWKASLWIFGLAVLGLSASLLLYGHAYGQAFWSHDLKWNLIDRARGLSNEHIESNWSYYGKWASRTAAALIPLSLAAPLGLLRLGHNSDDAGNFIGDFAAMLALTWMASLFVIQAQVINYLLPLEAAIVLSWALFIRRMQGRGAGMAALLALASFLSVRHHLDFEQGMLISLLGAFFLIFAGAAMGGCISGFTRIVVHGAILLALLLSAERYLRQPDDVYRPVADTLLAHPASREGEPLLYTGPMTQALNFYSLYQIKPQAAPKKGPRPAKEAQLFFDGQHCLFIPAKL